MADGKRRPLLEFLHLNRWIQLGLESAYWGMSLALVLSSETFLLARASSSVPTLIMLVSVQVLTCAMCWVLTKFRPRLFDRISPMQVCILFLVGTLSSLGIFYLNRFSASNSMVFLMIPVAICFGLGNSINASLLFDYCRLTSEEDFCFCAISGGTCAAVLCFGISYAQGSEVMLLCCFLVIGWYACYRMVSKRLAEREGLNFSFTSNRINKFSLVLSVVAISLSCGLVPSLIFSRSGQLFIEPFYDGFLFTLLGFSLVVFLLLSSIRAMPAVPSLARVCTLVVVTAFLAIQFRNVGVVLLPALSSVIIAAGQLVLASVVIYFCAHYMGDPKKALSKFWGVQILVLFSTFACTVTAAYWIAASGGSLLLFFSFLATYFLLFFVLAFQKVYVTPEQRSHTNQILPDSLNRLTSKRCGELQKEFRLTKREYDVLQRISWGWTTPMIAKHLVVSPDTVKTHLKHLYNKLDVHTREELMLLVYDKLG